MCYLSLLLCFSRYYFLFNSNYRNNLPKINTVFHLNPVYWIWFNLDYTIFTKLLYVQFSNNTFKSHNASNLILNSLMRSGYKEKVQNIFFLNLFRLLKTTSSDGMNVGFYRFNLLFRLDNLSAFFLSNFNSVFLKPTPLVRLSLFELSTDFLFTFKFHKINKLIRKYSRRRSGKYKIVFSYIMPYKRFLFLVKLFEKEVKFNHNQTFSRRLDSVLTKFMQLNTLPLILNLIKFLNIYVFRKLRSKAISKKFF